MQISGNYREPWRKCSTKKSKRYDTSHLIEDQFEPGSRGRVLKNKPGIISKRAMDRREKAEQIRTLEELTNIFDVDYIKAIQTGMAQNYKPMEKVFAAVIRKTLWVREQQ